SPSTPPLLSSPPQPAPPPHSGHRPSLSRPRRSAGIHPVPAAGQVGGSELRRFVKQTPCSRFSGSSPGRTSRSGTPLGGGERAEGVIWCYKQRRLPRSGCAGERWRWRRTSDRFRGKRAARRQLRRRSEVLIDPGAHGRVVHGMSSAEQTVTWLITLGVLHSPKKRISEPEGFLRLALLDGVVLCRLLERLMPGSIERVISEPKSEQDCVTNIREFLKGLSAVNVEFLSAGNISCQVGNLKGCLFPGSGCLIGLSTFPFL
uniref:Calponin-homology (CH) domain-containing protein n=1 Tax=Eptatretus burgeri TaxID=7764 RepID=A0A8C4NEK5_EPTBU